MEFKFSENFYNNCAEEFLAWYDAGKPNIEDANFYGVCDASYLSQYLIWECEDIEEVDKIIGEPRRWNQWVEFIFKIKDRYFSVGYDRGLTEMQENNFDDGMIEEVEPYERIITDWRVKK